MPNKANGSIENLGNENDNFMFVPVTGDPNQPQDAGSKRTIRKHVMRNYLDSVSDHPGNLHSTTKAVQGSGEVMKFKLRGSRLERAYPYRSRKKVQNGGAGANNALGGSRPDLQVGIASSASNLASENNSDIPKTPSLAQNIADLPDGSDQLQDYSLQLYSKRETSFPDSLASIHLLESSDRVLNQNGSTLLPTSPLFAFANSRLDPFDSLPIRLSPSDEVLVDHLQTYVSDAWCPVNGENNWLSFAINDPLLFHVTIYNWAANFTTIGLTPWLLRHRLEAMQLVSERLSKPTEIITDESIASIVLLASTEIIYNAPEAAIAHFAGLKRIVQMRGGVEALENSIGGLLQGLLCWVDLVYAELFNTPLQFRKRLTVDGVRSQSHQNQPKNVAETLESTPQQLPVFEGTLIKLLHEIRQVCDEVSARPQSTLHQNEKMLRSHQIHWIERQLFMLAEKPQDAVEGEDQSVLHYVWKSSALAGLLYVHTTLRGLSPANRQNGTLVQTLCDYISRSGNFKTEWSFAPEILLWALATGSRIAAGRRERPWFIKNLTEACIIYGYRTWDMFRETMKSFLWVDHIDRTQFFMVWQDVEVQLLGR